MISRVEAYQTNDGTVHLSIEAAVAHDLKKGIENGFADGSVVKVQELVDELATNPGFRSTFVKILGELG